MHFMLKPKVLHMDAPFCTYELKETVTRTRKVPNTKSPMTPEQAEKSRLQGDNIGILLNQLDFPLTCLDIDNAYDNATDTLKGSASYIVGICEPMGAIIERSQSGNGLHIFLAGNKPDNAKTCIKLSDGAKLECYDSNSKQFIALSFALINKPFKNVDSFYSDLVSLPSLDGQQAINQVAYEYLSVAATSKTTLVHTKHNLNDDAVVKIASNSKHGGQFKSLHFDGIRTEFNSDSEADYAYFKQLTFYTACNAEQMERIALKSALIRSKWNDKNYLKNTIKKCIEKATKVYSPKFSNTGANVVQFKGSLGITSKKEITTLINKCSDQHLKQLPYSIAQFLAKSQPLPLLQQQAIEYAAQIAKKRGFNCEKELIDTSLHLYKENLQNTYSFLNLDVDTNKVHKRFLDVNDAQLKGNDTLLVRSHMGTGKTYAVMKGNIDKLLAEKQHAKILVLSSRQQLCRKIAQDTGLNYYQDVKKMKTAQEKKQASCRIVTCINSISMLYLTFDYDLIIIDESELTFNHILGGTIAANERSRTVSDFYTLLKQANNVICLDAFISHVTHDAMCSAGRENIRLLNNTYNPWENIPVNWYTNKIKLVEVVNKTVESGENVFIFCNTKAGAQEKETDLKRRYPNKKILCINADTIKDDEQQACTHDTSLLKKYDVVVASPTIEAGFSIELEEFKNVFGFFIHSKEGTGAALSSLQQLGRARKAKSWNIWTDIKHYEYTTDPDLLLGEYVASHNFTVKHIKGGAVQATFTPNELTKLNISVKSWENTQRKALALILHAFIADYMGMTVNFIDKQGSKETKEELKTSAGLVREKRINDLVDAEMIDDSKHQELLAKQRLEGLVHSERLSLDKYDMLSMLPNKEELLEPENKSDLSSHAEMYLDGGTKKIRKLEQLTCDKHTALKYTGLKHDGGVRIDDDLNVHNIDALPTTDLAKNNSLLFRAFFIQLLAAGGYDASRLTEHSLEIEQLEKIQFSTPQIMQSNWHKFMLKNWQAINLLGVCSHIKDARKLQKTDVTTKIFISAIKKLGFNIRTMRKRVPRNDSPIYIENKLRGTDSNIETVVNHDLHGGANKGDNVRVRFYSLDVEVWLNKNATLWSVLQARFDAGINWVSEYCEGKMLHDEYENRLYKKGEHDYPIYDEYQVTTLEPKKINELTELQQKQIHNICKAAQSFDHARNECKQIEEFTLTRSDYTVLIYDQLSDIEKLQEKVRDICKYVDENYLPCEAIDTVNSLINEQLDGEVGDNFMLPYWYYIQAINGDSLNGLFSGEKVA